MREPRGIRNNNPGNIRHGDQWVGMSENQTDPDYVQFISPEYGIRAMARVLKTYRNSYGLNTIAEIVSRWAPPSENDTQSYIKSVAQRLAVNPDQPINDFHTPLLIAAIIQHENGQQPYSEETIAMGVAMA